MGVLKDLQPVKTEALSEEDIDNMQERYYQLGKISEAEDIARRIRADAGNYFKENNDKLAQVFRSLATIFEDEVAVRRKEWDTKYPKEAKP